MPFQSLNQMRACFAKKNPKWDCKEWAKETPNIKSLPKKKQKGGRIILPTYSDIPSFKPVTTHISPKDPSFVAQFLADHITAYGNITGGTDYVVPNDKLQEHSYKQGRSREWNLNNAYNYKTGHKMSEDFKSKSSIPSVRPENIDASQDALNLFLGVPQRKNSWVPSDFRPSKSNDTNSKYYKFRDEGEIINDLFKYSNSDFIKSNEQKRLVKNSHVGQAALRNFTYSKGQDDKGNYVSYYDKNDYGNILDLVGEPFDIYGRIYYDPKTGQPIKKQQGGYSTQGYKKNSPDKNNPYNVIPSSNITMQGVDHPVLGIDSAGFKQLMMPGEDYKFSSNPVLEIPVRQKGGNVAESTKTKIFVPKHFEPKFGSNDSLNQIENYLPTDNRSRSEKVLDRSKTVNSILTKASAIGELFPATRIPATVLGLILGMDAVVNDVKAGNRDELPLDIAGMLPGVPLSSSMRLPAKQAAKVLRAKMMFNTPKIIGTVGDLTDNGKDFGLNTIKQQGGEIKKFYNNYLNSPKYKQRLQTQGYTNPQQVITDRLNKLNTTKIVEPESNFGSQYDGKYNLIFLDKKEIEAHGDIKSDVLAHEYSHAAGSVGDGVNYMPDQLNNNTLNKNEILNIDKRNRYTGQYYSDPSTRHDARANEAKADIDAIRYKLKKDGIYDTGTQNFNQNILDKAKDVYKNNNYIKRLSKRFSDKDIIYLMNNIAYTESKENPTIAQKGGKIKPELLNQYFDIKTNMALIGADPRRTVSYHGYKLTPEEYQVALERSKNWKQDPSKPQGFGYQQGGIINPNVIDRNYGAAPNLTNLQPLQFNPLGNVKQQKDDTNLSYVPMFANSIAAALANRVSNSREKNYEMTNLANPLNYIPDTNNTNSYVNYGTPSYQEGGEFNSDQSNYEDLQDEDFLFEDATTPQEIAPEQPVITPEEVPQEESEFVLPLDESSPEMSSDLEGEGFVVPRSDGEGSASSRELDATNYLIQKGLPEHVAAGIVGNLKQESDLNPNATQRGGNGRGIAQWDARDRFQDLKRFAAQTGRPHNDLYTQLDYLLQEADSRGDLNKIKAAANPSEAAYLFAKHFERPKTIEQIRMKNAERIFKNRKA